jgi:uncharacterized protein YyaL (SSP411 family)
MLRALLEFERPRLQIVVRCPASVRNAWQSTLRDAVHDTGIVPGGDPADAFLIPDEATALPGLLAERTSRGDAGTAYVCAGLTCQAPVTSQSALVEALTRAQS